MGFLSALTGSSTGKATIAAANQNKGLLTDLQTKGNSIIDAGEKNSLGVLQPYVDSGSAANSMYSNANGLNGAEGNAAATDAFQAGPGYQFAMDQGTQAALRGASAAGMLNSGNTLTALNEYGQGVANQEFNGWLDRLKGISDSGQQAATGQAGIYQQGTANRLDLESGVTSGMLDTNNQIGAAKEAKNAAQGSFLGKLINGGVNLATGGKLQGLF